jgi:hypothetical protein
VGILEKKWPWHAVSIRDKGFMKKGREDLLSRISGTFHLCSTSNRVFEGILRNGLLTGVSEKLFMYRFKKKGGFPSRLTTYGMQLTTHDLSSPVPMEWMDRWINKKMGEG